MWSSLALVFQQRIELYVAPVITPFRPDGIPSGAVGISVRFGPSQGHSQVTLNGIPVVINSDRDDDFHHIPAGATQPLLVDVAPGNNIIFYFTVTATLSTQMVDQDVGQQA